MKRLLILCVFLASALWCNAVLAHALLERSDPAPGAVVKSAPAAVTLYFDAELESLFSKVVVKNGQGEKVSEGSETGAGGARTLSARLATKARGIYHVYWNVVSRDGHHASGDFTFTVQ
jgi:methionine-rich copper-binding protein CopC